MKSIPNAFGEKPVLKLMFAATLRASGRWRALRVTGFERRQMDALRRELNQNCEAGKTTSAGPRPICARLLWEPGDCFAFRKS